MAELTRYTDRMIRDSTPMPWDFYRADEVDALLKKVEQLQRDLDAAYAALRDVMDDLGDSLDWMEQDHAEVLKKAKEAVDGQAQPG
jgi:uncharacterized protein YoxC